MSSESSAFQPVYGIKLLELLSATFIFALDIYKASTRKNLTQSLYPNCGYSRIVIWIGESFALVIRMAKNPHGIAYFVFLDCPSPCLKKVLERYLVSSSDMQLLGRVS